MTPCLGMPNDRFSTSCCMSALFMTARKQFQPRRIPFSNKPPRDSRHPCAPSPKWGFSTVATLLRKWGQRSAQAFVHFGRAFAVTHRSLRGRRSFSMRPRLSSSFSLGRTAQDCPSHFISLTPQFEQYQCHLLNRCRHTPVKTVVRLALSQIVHSHFPKSCPFGQFHARGRQKPIQTMPL